MEMGKFVGGVVVFLLVVLSAFLVIHKMSRPHLPPPDNSWEKHSDRKGYSIYSRDGQFPGVKELLAVGILNRTPKQVFSVLSDYTALPEFMPNTIFAQVIESRQNTPARRVTFVFCVYEAALISPRYCTLEIVDEIDIMVEQQPGCYRRTWRLVKEGRFRRTPNSAQIKEVLQVDEGTAEVRQDEGYLLLEPVDEGRKTKVTYFMARDPGAMILTMAVNRTNLKAIPQWWKAVRNRLESLYPRR